MTRPTPCQQCKADLERARALIDAMEAGGQDQLQQLQWARERINELTARIAELDAKCLENAESYDALLESRAVVAATDEERAVLDAWALVPEGILRGFETAKHHVGEACKAELARRSAKGQTPETP